MPKRATDPSKLTQFFDQPYDHLQLSYRNTVRNTKQPLYSTKSSWNGLSSDAGTFSRFNAKAPTIRTRSVAITVGKQVILMEDDDPIRISANQSRGPSRLSEEQQQQYPQQQAGVHNFGGPSEEQQIVDYGKRDGALGIVQTPRRPEDSIVVKEASFTGHGVEQPKAIAVKRPPILDALRSAEAHRKAQSETSTGSTPPPPPAALTGLHETLPLLHPNERRRVMEFERDERKAAEIVRRAKHNEIHRLHVLRRDGYLDGYGNGPNEVGGSGPLAPPFSGAGGASGACGGVGGGGGAAHAGVESKRYIADINRRRSEQSRKRAEFHATLSQASRRIGYNPFVVGAGATAGGTGGTGATGAAAASSLSSSSTGAALGQTVGMPARPDLEGGGQFLQRRRRREDGNWSYTANTYDRLWGEKGKRFSETRAQRIRAEDLGGRRYDILTGAAVTTKPPPPPGGDGGGAARGRASWGGGERDSVRRDHPSMWSDSKHFHLDR